MTRSWVREAGRGEPGAGSPRPGVLVKLGERRGGGGALGWSCARPGGGGAASAEAARAALEKARRGGVASGARAPPPPPRGLRAEGGGERRARGREAGARRHSLGRLPGKANKGTGRPEKPRRSTIAGAGEGSTENGNCPGLGFEVLWPAPRHHPTVPAKLPGPSQVADLSSLSFASPECPEWFSGGTPDRVNVLIYPSI